MTAAFERQAYRVALAGAFLLGLVAAVLAFVGLTQVSIGLLALVAAAVPVLLHLQTRQLVLAQARADKRSVEKIIASMPRPSAKGSVVPAVDLKPVLAAQEQTDKDLRDVALAIQANSAGEISTFANEIRRESRMLRLTAAQLVEELRASEAK